MKPSKNYSLLTPFYSVLLLLLAQQLATAQNVGIGTTTPNANAALEIRSSNKGLLIPRLSSAGRNAMANVAKGMMVYDTTASAFFYHDGSKWRTFAEPNLDSTINTSYPGAVPDTLIMRTNIFTSRNSNKLTGFIFDDGGPTGNYSNNSNSTYYFGNDAENVLYYKIEIQQLNTEANEDILEVSPVYDAEANRRYFSGNTTTSFNVYDKRFIITFRTSSAINNSGIKVKWTAITGSSTLGLPPPLQGWYYNPQKKAGRAGFNFGNTFWNADKLGIGSYAIGDGALAESLHSFALGGESKARDTGAVAIGYGSDASGLHAVSIGNYNRTEGDYGTALGRSNHVRGNSSAVGLGWYNQAIGDGSITIGADNYSGGIRGIAIGTQNKVEGEYSVAMGTKLYIPPAAAGAMGLGDLEFSNNPVDITNIGFSNQLVARFRNGYYFITSANAPGGSISNRTGVQIGPGGNSWSAISDSRRKENFIPVDGESILQKIAAMPLSTWNYKAQDPATMRHYGPMAQDFFAAFGKDQLGLIGCDTLINQQDFLGINLSAIQALEKRTTQLKEDNIQLVQQLTQEIMLLKKELEAVKKQVGKKEE
jgi:hypothetical protein